MSRRRFDPTGKQALFQSPVTAAADRVVSPTGNEGRAALFSTPPRRRGTVVVECSGCHGRSRATVLELAARLFSGSVWLPLRGHQHWMRCPSCGQRRWCRVGWTE